MTDATGRQRDVWQKAAPDYDRKISSFERAFLRGGREWIGARARGRTLEVAIGTGRSIPFYADDVQLTGVDLTPEMLDVARRRFPEVTLVEGDAQQLPFADGEFDTVVCALGLCSIPDPAAAIREMHRVLKPGGRLLLLDHIGSSWPPVWVLQWLVERITIPTAGEHFTRRQLAPVLSAGFGVDERERSKAGTIERIAAVKPGEDAAS